MTDNTPLSEKECYFDYHAEEYTYTKNDESYYENTIKNNSWFNKKDIKQALKELSKRRFDMNPDYNSEEEYCGDYPTDEPDTGDFVKWKDVKEIFGSLADEETKTEVEE